MNTPHADTPDQYFQQAGERETLLRSLDQMIRTAAPRLERSLFREVSGQWVAYGLQRYQTKSKKEPILWPVVALANQKNYVSVYVMAVEDGNYLAELYADRLGKVSVGRSCIRIKRLEDVNQESLVELLSDVNKRYDTQKALL